MTISSHADWLIVIVYLAPYITLTRASRLFAQKERFRTVSNHILKPKNKMKKRNFYENKFRCIITEFSPLASDLDHFFEVDKVNRFHSMIHRIAPLLRFPRTFTGRFLSSKVSLSCRLSVDIIKTN